MQTERSESPPGPSEKRRPRRASTVAALMVALIGVFYLLREHWGHVVGLWPYVLLLACPLMHWFMHRGHGHADHHRAPPDRTPTP